MSCNKPLFRVEQSKLTISASHLPYIVNGGVIFSQDQYDRFINDFRIDPRDCVKIPCGSCLGCRLAYSKQWAIRCMLEAQYHSNNYFVTLTYSDSFLPRGNYLDMADSFAVKDSSLHLPDVQNFLKRLRTNAKREFNHEGIRVFYSGEYGELYDRPHYHLILFNMPKLDLTLLRSNGSYNYYRSSFLEEAWSDRGISMGYVTVTDFCFETAAYVARYMLKKQKGQIVKEAKSMDLPDDFSIRTNPFAHQSRKPGLAYSYFKDHSFDIYLNGTDDIMYSKQFEVFHSKPPRYFDRLFDGEFPGFDIILDEIKDRRQDKAFAALSTLPLDQFDYLNKEEERLQRKERRKKVIL